jgi:hypothetical protein
MRPSDEVTDAAAITGPRGRAWAIDLEGAYVAAGRARETGFDVACWIVEAPWAHPVWHSYGINLIHLRQVPEQPPLHFYLAGATHEMFVAALDPGRPRQRMLETGTLARLLPLNFGAQFIATNDADAMGRVERAVRLICAGRLSPDTDFIQQWIDLFGTSNMIHQS